MNAVLAKPIHAIWFIHARTVDLHQSFAAALFASLTSWLRDHLARSKLAAPHNQKISTLDGDVEFLGRGFLAEASWQWH
jgi:hypothetical protein